MLCRYVFLLQKFNGCDNLTNINLSNFNTKNVMNMSKMFSNCFKLTNINLSNFNTQNVMNMSGMFSKCNNLTNIIVVNKLSRSKIMKEFHHQST